MSKIVGIDLGTTKSVIAVTEAEKPIVIPNAEGERVTPSVVGFNPNIRQLLVGTPARRQAETNPQNTLFSIKRFIGRNFGDPIIEQDVKLAPYKIRRADDDGISIWMGESWYSPPEILAVLLRKLKQDAEAYIGEAVTQAVISVPSYFNDSQRQATKNSSHLAGLETVRLINKSTAACLAYGLTRNDDKLVAVYHLGGGSFDISIIEISEGLCEVVATNGDAHLGGDDFDQRIIEWACDEFQKEQGVDLRQDRVALQRLKWAAEKAKCELSAIHQAAVKLPYLISVNGDHRDLSMTLTRAKLEELVGDLIEKTLVPCEQALADASISRHEVDEVVLVGQQTLMPAVQEVVKRFFGQHPRRGVDPAEGAALGAAIRGGVLMGELRDVVLLDVTPLTLSIETHDGSANPLIKRNTTIPTRRSEIFSTSADDQTSLDINVYQGESQIAADNVLVGRFRLEGIPPAQKGIPDIEVTFAINADGILSVLAQDKTTGQEKRVTPIAPGTVISKKELAEARRGTVTEPNVKPENSRLPIVKKAAIIGGGGAAVVGALEYFFGIISDIITFCDFLQTTLNFFR
jgi:molecular chaperone DnaK